MSSDEDSIRSDEEIEEEEDELDNLLDSGMIKFGINKEDIKNSEYQFKKKSPTFLNILRMQL